MKNIPSAQITKHHSFDVQGYLFRWRGQLYRAIYPKREKDVIDLIQSGLLSELTERGLFPKSEVVEYATDDCNLVIKHEQIPVATLPTEWSFSMLQDAARTVIHVNQIAFKYGYQTIDAHGFNILFARGAPVFVDLGSFVKISSDFGCQKPGWRPFGEFMRCFYAPLKLWSAGEPYFARHSLHGSQMPMATLWRYQHMVFRLIPLTVLSNFEFLYYKYKALNTLPQEEFEQFASLSAVREKLGRWILRLAKMRLLLFSSVNLDKLDKRVARIGRPSIRSTWAAYHDRASVSGRHKHVLDLIKQYKIKTVLDMAGNAGFLSRQILQVECVEQVICADYDENAIDSLYRNLKGQGVNLVPAIMNFSSSISDSKFRDVVERFQSDCVVALALTHHLLLTQKLTLDYILERLKAFSKKYVFVEFMPLGLYSSQHEKEPLVPDWYHIDWFREGFLRHFRLLEETTLEKNRVLLTGEIARDAAATQD